MNTLLHVAVIEAAVLVAAVGVVVARRMLWQGVARFIVWLIFRSKYRYNG